MKININAPIFASILLVVVILSALSGWLFVKKSQNPASQTESTLSPQADLNIQAETTASAQLNAKSDPENGTTDWKTYVYDELGISMRYPEGELGDNDRPGYASAITYDTPIDGLFQWTMSERNASELSAIASCDALREKANQAGIANDELYLPSLFKSPNLCGTIKSVDRVIFYVIGKDIGFESLPSIDGGLLILDKERAIVINGLLIDKTNTDLEIWADAYLKKHPSVEFPNSEFHTMLLLAHGKIDKALLTPSASLSANFESLHMIATSVSDVSDIR